MKLVGYYNRGAFNGDEEEELLIWHCLRGIQHSLCRNERQVLGCVKNRNKALIGFSYIYYAFLFVK